MLKLKALMVVALIASIGTPGAGTASAHYTKMTDVRVQMDDGVSLAADVYVPTAADGDGDGLYPCVVELTPYRKENRAAEGASYLPDRGIAVIEVDARGTGGSGGEYDVVFSIREQADAVAWVNWAATAATNPGGGKLCEERVGMYGGSYSGIIQYLAASLPLGAGDAGFGRLPQGSPYLSAIAPQRAYGDLYRDIVYHGGQLIGSFGQVWSTGTTAFYTQPPMDLNTPAGQAAWLDHLQRNDPMMLNYLRAPYADATFTSNGTTPSFTQMLYEDSSVLPRIQNLRVPALHLAGFFDSFTRGQLLTFQRAHALERELGGRGPNFLIAGPWNHSGTHFITPDQGFKEHLGQWYRHWLEGAAAPAWMTEGFDGAGARVHYFRSVSGRVNGGTEADGKWLDSPAWPPPGLRAQRLYLRAGQALSATPPGEEYADVYAYNPSAGTAEILSRWDNAASGQVPHPQWDQRTDGVKGLTYQTEQLTSDLNVTGPVSMKLFAMTAGAPEVAPFPSTPVGAEQLFPSYHDTDWVVKLSDVAPDGTTLLVSSGYLRASHRAYDPARSETLDGEVVAPFHLHTASALEVPSGVRDYIVEIWPVAKTFAAGHRLRIDVYSADTPNHLTLLKPAINSVLHSEDTASYLTLPVAS